jgi:hypothetical protein
MIGPEGSEVIATQRIFDFLEVPLRSRTTGAARRLCKLMTQLGWTPIRCRGRARGELRERVRGYCRNAQHVNPAQSGR